MLAIIANQGFVLLKVIKNGFVVNFLADAFSCHKIKFVFIFINVPHTIMCCECVCVCVYVHKLFPSH